MIVRWGKWLAHLSGTPHQEDQISRSAATQRRLASGMENSGTFCWPISLNTPPSNIGRQTSSAPARAATRWTWVDAMYAHGLAKSYQNSITAPSAVAGRVSTTRAGGASPPGIQPPSTASTCSSRSWPQNRRSPCGVETIEVGTPKTPRAIASSVRRRSSSFRVGVADASSGASGAMPQATSARRRTDSSSISSPRSQ